MTQCTIGGQASRLARDLTLGSPTPTKTTIPKLVYGSAWKKDRTADLVYLALKNGFRGVDTAAQPKHYHEPGVGEGMRRAISENIIKREDLFIQTKFTVPKGQGKTAPYELRAPLVDQVHQSVRSSLRNFTYSGNEPYIDSFVMHSPLETLEDTLTVWRTLETYVPHKIRKLGISNVTLPVLQSLYDGAMEKPCVVQNRFHEETDFEVDLRAFCKARGIIFQSFWTLSANPTLVSSRPVSRVAKEADVEVEAAYYALVLGLENVVILDGTTNTAHMRDDLEGIEKVGAWAETSGSGSWTQALKEFKGLIGEE